MMRACQHGYDAISQWSADSIPGLVVRRQRTRRPVGRDATKGRVGAAWVRVVAPEQASAQSVPADDGFLSSNRQAGAASASSNRQGQTKSG
jgi:hypothetical protein